MSILQSIKPQYCELIASGKKTIEVRKTRPKLQTPFKVYIYCTKDKLLTKSHNNGNIYRSEIKYKSALEKAGNITLSGKVIGEYVCDEIEECRFDYLHEPPFQNIKCYLISDGDLKQTCLTYEELNNYGNRKPLYLWHISDLVIYDKPKELSEFYRCCKNDDCDNCQFYGVPYEGQDDAICLTHEKLYLLRPPQSWCYINVINNIRKMQGR